MLIAALLFAAKLAATCTPATFITRAYEDLLGRPIDDAAKATWIAAMKNGTSRTQVAAQMIKSAEYRNERVRELYNAYLHRPPSTIDAGYFAGMTSEQIEESILGSPEYFKNRGGSTNQGFLIALYQDVLGRAADPQASALFTQQLGTGTTRSAIAQQLLSSAEARQRWIRALELKYLHRAGARTPVAGGYEQVAATIIGSDEYCRQ